MLYTAVICYIIVFFFTYAQMFTCTSVCLLHFTTFTLPSMHSTLLYNMYCHSNFCGKMYTYVQLHIFRIICIGYSDFLTLYLKHYAYVDWSILFVLAKEHSMSLPLCCSHTVANILANVKKNIRGKFARKWRI